MLKKIILGIILVGCNVQNTLAMHSMSRVRVELQCLQYLDIVQDAIAVQQFKMRLEQLEKNNFQGMTTEQEACARRYSELVKQNHRRDALWRKLDKHVVMLEKQGLHEEVRRTLDNKRRVFREYTEGVQQSLAVFQRLQNYGL